MHIPVARITTREDVSDAGCPWPNRAYDGPVPSPLSQTGTWASRLCAVMGLLLLTAAGTAFGQLSPADIEALRKQGEAEGWTFTVGENPATSRPMDELCGLVVPDDWWVDAPFDPCTPGRSLPEYFNWCDLGGCTSVKNQGSCGSCWAFATVGPLECNILIKDGLEVDLSEQWLVSCNSNGWSCGGGWWAHMYHEWKTDPCGGTGAVLEADFPYEALDLPCDCPYPHQYLIDGFAYIGDPWTDPINPMKQAIMDHGPITVGVDASGFSAYTGGVFNNCVEDVGINHGVTLVGWDDNQGSNGVWFLRNSWGPWWGENGYMRIEYRCNGVGHSACYVDYPGTPALDISLPDGTPRILAPGVVLPIEVQIEEVTDFYIPGTAEVHYRYDDGGWLTEPLDFLGGSLFHVTLPAASCGDMPEFYFSAQSERGDIIYNPLEGSVSPYTVGVGELVVTFADDFETDQGWTVEDSLDPLLAGGTWERGVPVDCDRGDPSSDYDGSGQCYLTENDEFDCNSDVDDGATRLISPTLDLSSGLARIHYALWYTNDSGYNPNEDVFKIHVSNNNGASWTLVKTIGPQSPPEEWIERSLWIGDYITLTDQMKVRFVASDIDSLSIVEAGLDDFYVSMFECIPVPTCDDGIQNQDEERIDCGGPCPPCYCTTDAECDDEQYCNGFETCDEFGSCQLGAAPCPGQMCDEDADICVTEECYVDSNCDDELYCNGEETCVESTCWSGTPVACSDNVRCTVDSCNEGTDSCDNIPDDTLCDNGLYCDGAETCDEVLGCQGGSYPCPGQLCNEDNDTCIDCLVDDDCDDGLFCNGIETCDGMGVCQPGTPPCGDGFICDEESETCILERGACCWGGGLCSDNETEDNCAWVNGRFLGGGMTCDGDPDGDNVVGCDDGCPLDPNKAEPGVCGCGVADDDSDTDGVPNCVDLCPNTPDGVAVDANGCPRIGACCFFTGGCDDDSEFNACFDNSGVYQGDGSTCDEGCVFPTGDGDYDENTNVDLYDFEHWPDCMTGPENGPYRQNCGAFDFNGDTNIDLFDFAEFQTAFDVS